MKSGLILILTGLVIFFGFSASLLKKELQSAKGRIVLLEEINDKLQREVMRLGKVNAAGEQFLNELDSSVRELEAKMPPEALEKYIPKGMLKDIKPVIDRLRLLRESSGDKEKI